MLIVLFFIFDCFYFFNNTQLIISKHNAILTFLY